MHKPSSLRKHLNLLTVVALLYGQVAGAVTLEIAQKAVDQFKALPKVTRADSDFARWTHDTALLTVHDCWRSGAAGQKNAALDNGFISAGSYSLPNDEKLELLCASVAKHGIAPVCTHSTLWAKNAPAAPNLPGYYIVFNGDPAKLELEGMLKCYLNADQIGEQSFVTHLLTEWAQLPTLKTVNLPGGPQNLRMGTVLVKVPTARGLSGEPYSEPRSAVQF